MWTPHTRRGEWSRASDLVFAADWICEVMEVTDSGLRILRGNLLTHAASTCSQSALRVHCIVICGHAGDRLRSQVRPLVGESHPAEG